MFCKCGLTNTEERIKYVTKESNELSMIFLVDHTDLIIGVGNDYWSRRDSKV